MIILFENLHNITWSWSGLPIILSYISDLLPHNKDNWERRQIIRYHIHAIEFCPSLLGYSATENIFSVQSGIHETFYMRSWMLSHSIVFQPNHSLYSLAIRFVCVYFPKANTINFWKVEYKNVFPYAIIAVALAIKYEIEWRMEICCLFYVGKNVLFLAF